MSVSPPRAVLQVHTRYLHPGGEDQVVEAEKRLLEGAGISVHQVIFHNAELGAGRSRWGDIRLAASAIWSRTAERRVRTAIAAHRPDVLHVHNTFAAASPSVYAAAGAVPVVQTLHNYRMVCPIATAFRDGHACTDCVGRAVPWPGVMHACLHDSRSQSAVAAATVAVHRALGTFQNRIGQYIALTAFQQRLMVRGGLPEERIRVIPNFLEPDPGSRSGPRSKVLYLGRLVEEKGVGILLRAAALLPRALRVAGDGPLQVLVEASVRAGEVDYLGRVDASAVPAELGRSVALVLPSIWFEGMPVTVLQAYATGTPVIASRIGSLAEVVEDGMTGLLVEPHDHAHLADRVRWAIDNPEAMRRMGSNARQAYEARFRGPTHFAALLDTYVAAASVSQGRAA